MENKISKKKGGGGESEREKETDSLVMRCIHVNIVRIFNC